MIQISIPHFGKSKTSLHLSPNTICLPHLNKNEVIEGKVLRYLPQGKALLLIKGKNVVAKTYVPLKDGQILPLKVENLSPMPTFRLLGANTSGSNIINIPIILSAVKDNLWQSLLSILNQQKLPIEALNLLKGLIDNTTMEIFLKSSPEILNVLIDKSGLNWESKLKKELLRKKITRSTINKLTDGDMKGLASKYLFSEKGAMLKKLISVLNNIQLLNHIGTERERKLFLPVPMQFPDGPFSVGQLLLCLPEKRNTKKEGQRTDKNTSRITFLLEMSNLGPLRVDLSINKMEISGRFLVKGEETRLLIKKNIHIFKDRLKGAGFSIRSVEFQIQAPQIIKQSLVEEILNNEVNTINLVA